MGNDAVPQLVVERHPAIFDVILQVDVLRRARENRGNSFTLAREGWSNVVAANTSEAQLMTGSHRQPTRLRGSSGEHEADGVFAT